jgi:hypothetical protein
MARVVAEKNRGHPLNLSINPPLQWVSMISIWVYALYGLVNAVGATLSRREQYRIDCTGGSRLPATDLNGERGITLSHDGTTEAEIGLARGSVWKMDNFESA